LKFAINKYLNKIYDIVLKNKNKNMERRWLKECFVENQFVEEINKEIFNWELTDIIEVTYTYKNLWNWKLLNEAIFYRLTWEKPLVISESDNIIVRNQKINNHIQKVYKSALNKLQIKKQKIAEFKDILAAQWNLSPRMQILKGTLDYVEWIIDLTLTWLPFEWEKMWIPHWLSDEEITQRVQTLEDIESKLFWWNVRDNQFEIHWSIKMLEKDLRKWKQNLTPEELKRFKWYISMLRSLADKDYEKTPSQRSKKNSTEQYKKLLWKKVAREDYVRIFELVFEIYWINKPVIVKEWLSSIYDSDEWLLIPAGKADETRTLYNVIQLIKHEIESHYINLVNNKKVLWDFKWGKNLDKEEWLATIAETIWEIPSIESLRSIWLAIPAILMWEILDWEEFKDFYTLYYKVLWSSANANAMLLRRKRNYPMKYKWVQHKDTTYSRWKRQIADFIAGWWDLHDLYLWKVGLQDLEAAKQIVNWEWIKLKYPILIWEILFFLLTEKKEKRSKWKYKWTNLKKDFLAYIKKRYPFEIPTEWVEDLNKDNKKRLIEILNLLEKPQK